MKRITIAGLVAASFLLASCSDPNLLSRDSSTFLDKKIESPFFGNENAKVQMTVFTDFQCPACIQFDKIIAWPLVEQYADTGKIGLEYRMYPLPNHKNAPEDALAALCAESAWKYKEFSKEMYGLEEMKKWDKVDPSEREAIAKKIRLDLGAFQRCMKEGNYVSKIKEDMALWDKFWLRGTPSVYINGKNVTFKSREGLFKIIDAMSATGTSDAPSDASAPKNQ